MATSIRSRFFPFIFLVLALTADAQSPASNSLPKPFDPCVSVGLRKTVVCLGFRESSDDVKQAVTNELIGTGTLIAHPPLTYITLPKVLCGRRRGSDMPRPF